PEGGGCAAAHPRKLPRTRPGDAPRKGTGPPLRPQGCYRIACGDQCRVVKACCLEVNNVVAISGLRSGAVGGGAGWSGRAGEGVPAAAGFGEEGEGGAPR